MIALQTKLPVLFICSFIASMNCTAQKNHVPAENATDRQKIYVQSLSCQDVISKNETLEVRIRGSLPSPAYTFNRFDVKTEDNVIEMIPVATFDPSKTVVQVLVAFEEVCNVENLESGTYELRVVGRGDTTVSKSNVRVRE